MGQGLEGSEGRGANVLLSGGPPFHVMVVLSGTRVLRALCVVMDAPSCVAACVCVGVAPNVLGDASRPLVALILNASCS